MLPGKNIFAAEAENEGPIANPAGLLVSLQVEYTDGSRVRFYSNNQWKASDAEPSGNWQSLAFDDKEWKNARNYGDFSMESGVVYRHLPKKIFKPTATCSRFAGHA
ncbi:MAG: hypothetical protein R3C61_17200 [Bacteroidia bacterium]